MLLLLAQTERGGGRPHQDMYRNEPVLPDFLHLPSLSHFFATSGLHKCLDSRLGGQVKLDAPPLVSPCKRQPHPHPTPYPPPHSYVHRPPPHPPLSHSLLSSSLFSRPLRPHHPLPVITLLLTDASFVQIVGACVWGGGGGRRSAGCQKGGMGRDGWGGEGEGEQADTTGPHRGKVEPNAKALFGYYCVGARHSSPSVPTTSQANGRKTKKTQENGIARKRNELRCIEGLLFLIFFGVLILDRPEWNATEDIVSDGGKFY